MLKVLKVSDVRFIALLAKAARMQSDELLGNVAEADFGEPVPSRGDHNVLASLGLEDLPAGASQRDLLSGAVNRLSGAALHELRVCAHRTGTSLSQDLRPRPVGGGIAGHGRTGGNDRRKSRSARSPFQSAL